MRVVACPYQRRPRESGERIGVRYLVNLTGCPVRWHRLAFRELGLAIGIHGLPSNRTLVGRNRLLASMSGSMQSDKILKIWLAMPVTFLFALQDYWGEIRTTDGGRHCDRENCGLPACPDAASSWAHHRNRSVSLGAANISVGRSRVDVTRQDCCSGCATATAVAPRGAAIRVSQFARSCPSGFDRHPGSEDLLQTVGCYQGSLHPLSRRPRK